MENPPALDCEGGKCSYCESWLSDFRGARRYRLGEQSQLSQRRTSGSLNDTQAHFAGSYARTANQAEISDARAMRELHPLAVSPLVQGKRLHPLAERQLLTQTNHVEPELRNRRAANHRGTGFQPVS